MAPAEDAPDDLRFRQAHDLVPGLQELLDADEGAGSRADDHHGLPHGTTSRRRVSDASRKKFPEIVGDPSKLGTSFIFP